MQPRNTRFNPTPSGNSLHIGHIYMILVNRGEARRTGGVFGLRFDDSQRYWVDKLGKEGMARIVAKMHDELEWLDIEPDTVTSQSDYPEIKELAMQEFGKAALFEDIPAFGDACFFAKFHPLPKNVAETYSQSYPYDPFHTQERVLTDWKEGINCLIRGGELVTESSLYCYLCEYFGVPWPEQIYIPKMASVDRIISTTVGAYNITDLREAGVSAPAILSAIRRASLIDPDGDFILDNLKTEILLREEWLHE